MENHENDIHNIILDELRIVQKDVKSIQSSVDRLEVKAGVWGTVSGALAAIAILLGFPKSH